MIIHRCVQGSDEWLRLRLGIPTASRFDSIVTPKKMALSAASKGYAHELLAEWIYGEPIEAFVSPWMERGEALEAEAVRYFELETGLDTSKVGFITTDDGMVGASPDRLIGDDGTLEQKCPSPKVHVGYMVDPHSLVEDYQLQVQGQLWVSERRYAYIQSYCPRFPSVIVRVERKEDYITDLSLCVRSFVDVLLAARLKL